MPKQAIGVKFQSRKEKGVFNGREYTYCSEDIRKVGDVIKVPTKRGATTVQITRVDIPLSEIDPKIPITIIPAGYGGEPQMPKKFKKIIAAWNMWEDIEPDISTEQLFARVESDTGYDAGDISEALLYAQEANEVK